MNILRRSEQKCDVHFINLFTKCNTDTFYKVGIPGLSLYITYRPCGTILVQCLFFIASFNGRIKFLCYSYTSRAVCKNDARNAILIVNGCLTCCTFYRRRVASNDRRIFIGNAPSASAVQSRQFFYTHLCDKFAHRSFSFNDIF